MENENEIQTALFTNFSDKDFLGWWNGKSKRFKPGQSLWMPAYLARHFAKHLANREILKYPKGDTMTSPKKPEDVPIFMRLFEKAYTPDKSKENEIGDKKDDIDAIIESTNRNKQKESEEIDALKKKASGPQDPTKPQVVMSPDFDRSEKKDESTFEGIPVEENQMTGGNK